MLQISHNLEYVAQAMGQKDELLLNFNEQPPKREVHTTGSWSGVTVQYSRLHQPAPYEFRWEGAAHYLAHHDLVLDDGEMEILGERPVAGGDLRDRMTYVPAGQAITGWAKPADRLNAFTVVCFDPGTMETELQQEMNGSEPYPHIYFTDIQLGATMQKLGRLMADLDGPVSRLHAETVGLTAALEMFQLSRTAKQRVPKSGQLSTAQMRLVLTYVEEHLATDISLDDLATICGLTRFHFSRAFKASNGEPPYRYVTRRRIAMARQLLMETQWSIAAIATACGFNGASQFARAFRDVTGETPLQFRRGT